MIARIVRYWRQNGAARTFLFLCGRVMRRRRYVVYEALMESGASAPDWRAGEELCIIGPDNLDAEMTPALLELLGGDEAFESLEGVRRGDRLFVIRNGRQYQHRGYILFNTRQTLLLGEPSRPPLIANCFTARGAEGRGLYRRALKAELQYLAERGYKRAVIETDPENIASRKGIEAAGFTFCREVMVWILLNTVVLQRTIQTEAMRTRVLLLPA